MTKHDHTQDTPGRTTPDKGKEITPGRTTPGKDHNFSYTYSEQFGKEDTTPGREGTDKQDDIDKKVLKRLSQVYKENSLTYPQLRKRLYQELQKSMDLDKPRKDTLSENLDKTLRAPQTPGPQGTHQGGYTDYRQTQKGRESLKLESIPYSNRHTKVQSNRYHLTIKTTSYIEQCTLIPECLDCTRNHSYSQCTQRKPVKHTIDHTIPFSQFWAYGLHGTS